MISSRLPSGTGMSDGAGPFFAGVESHDRVDGSDTAKSARNLVTRTSSSSQTAHCTEPPASIA
jgi:hypothetical protein